ncbi:MAG: hypothetical protein VCA74_03715 [Deltaproteobacteria bacterium]
MSKYKILLAGGLVVGAVFVCTPALAQTVTSADEICNAADDPCIVYTEWTIAAGAVLDFGLRELLIQGGDGRLTTGSGAVTIKCGTFTVSVGNVTAIWATDDNGGGDLSIEARKACSNDSQRPCLTGSDCTGGGECSEGSGAIAMNGKIVGQDSSTPANINLNAAGDVTIDQIINLRGTTSDADGGSLDIQAGGSVVINAGLDVTPGNQGDGGSVTITAGGDIEVNEAIDADGGEWPDEVDITAGGNITVRADITVNSTAGGGDGGEVTLDAAGDIQILAGATLSSNGNKGSDGWAGDGGDFFIDAGGDLTIGSSVTISANGAKPDGGGGMIDMYATNISVGGTVEATGNGAWGMGGEVAFTADGTFDLAVGGTIDVSGKGGGGAAEVAASGTTTIDGTIDAGGGNNGSGGDIEVDGDGDVQISGSLKNSGAAGSSSSNGTVDITGCVVELVSGAKVQHTGDYGKNIITGRESITIGSGSQMKANGTDGTNKLVYRLESVPPAIFGTVSPDAILMLNTTMLSCYGVTTTTTTTSTTTTTTTTTTTLQTQTICGDADGNGTILASDALMVLKAAVGLVPESECPTDVCDVDGNCSVLASDALMVLQRAVGIINDAALSCPANCQ